MSYSPQAICAVAPSTLAVNEPFSLGLRVLTQPYCPAVSAFTHDVRPLVTGPFNLSPRGIRYMDNVMREWAGQLTIDGGRELEGPVTTSFAEGAGPYRNDRRAIRRIDGLRFTTPGIKFVRVRDPASGVEGISNPIGVEAQSPSERLFWGDLHTHTFFTDAIRCPEEIYAFARDEAFLDICALSDHSEALTDTQWEYFVNVTNRFNEPGRFATLVGGEWTNMRYGHRNYYYRGDGGPILRCTDPRYESLANFHLAAHRHGALVVPHHPANASMGVDWSQGHHAEVERLVEIHSVWGNSERPAARGNPLPIRDAGGEKIGQHVVDALASGYHLGFIGGGDIHDGRPGDALSSLQYQSEGFPLERCQGLMGVWARELTRDAIFEALWNRRVYATTSKRTWLRFSIDGHPMGARITANGDLSARTEAASDSPIVRIDLVCNGDDVQVSTPGRREVAWRTRVAAPPEQSWYYVRLTRQDGHLAWSSPIWVGRDD